ncbi:hypothetical protein CJ030_MR2G026719 [Morella rubra]|uniref:Embryonic stem cell-specific 5-hydroxymethylcytosine-binding protein n=1 Tax=Morella rubra TaxID=262757 RepID=A0A6A1WAI9_9ROSI|nr:hypothetical protein CJ030_MR2G026719 [Morella rubra]
MCGRFPCTLRADDIPRACHRYDCPVRTVDMERYRPSYNIPPGHYLPVVRREDGSDGDGIVLHCMLWGLIPSFTKKTEKPNHYRMFNAQSETIFEKASFRRLIPKNRCHVAVNGFYEWKKDGPKKQPYYIHFKDGRPLVFAALYDSWKNSEGNMVYTFTILTTSSSSALKWLHDRMPVILGDKASTDTWLNGSPSSKLDNVLKPYEDPDLEWYPVTPAVGKTSFDGPECIEIQFKAEKNKPISKFFTEKQTKKERQSTSEDKNSEQESASEEKNSTAESLKNDPPESLKREPNTEDNVARSSFNEKGAQDSKSTVVHPEYGKAKSAIKRDYEEFKADSEAPTDEFVQRCSTPARKKGNLKRASDGQSTLLSYYNKN